MDSLTCKTLTLTENNITCRIHLLSSVSMDASLSTKARYTPREFIQQSSGLIEEAMQKIRSRFNNDGSVSFWMECIGIDNTLHQFHTESVPLNKCLPAITCSELMDMIKQKGLDETTLQATHLIIESNSSLTE